MAFEFEAVRLRGLGMVVTRRHSIRRIGRKQGVPALLSVMEVSMTVYVPVFSLRLFERAISYSYLWEEMQK